MTEVDRMDLIELKWAEIDQIGPKWTEYRFVNFVISIAKIVFVREKERENSKKFIENNMRRKK